MRFCQTDGTPLVDETPAVDPYKTMVASKDEIAAAMGSQGKSPDPEPAAKADEEVLQLPNEIDPRKTMYASEEEIRKEMAAHDDPVVDLPPLAPEPPKFSEPDLMPPVFGDAPPASPPPSPFSSPGEPISSPADDQPFAKTTPPIPSPFDKPKPSSYDPAPAFSSAAEPEPTFGNISSPLEPASTPLEPAASAPVQNWEPNEPMQNVPTPVGQNKTLAIVSLVSGILGLTICCGGFLPSLLGVILGFMARSKANQNPAEYGGAGLATAGLITGAIGIVGSIIVWILYVFYFAAIMASMPR